MNVIYKIFICTYSTLHIYSAVYIWVCSVNVIVQYTSGLYIYMGTLCICIQWKDNQFASFVMLPAKNNRGTYTSVRIYKRICMYVGIFSIRSWTKSSLVANAIQHWGRVRITSLVVVKELTQFTSEAIVTRWCVDCNS